MFRQDTLGMPNGRFKPGDRVPVAGIYTASHAQHRESHEVFAKEGDSFPECRTCGEGVRFALAHAATRIEDEGGYDRARKAKAGRKRKKKSAGKD